MKTAISIPDAVFEAAERYAKQTRRSRSQLFTEAMAEYLVRHSPDEVTQRLNETLSRLDPERDPFRKAAGDHILGKEEW